MGLSHIRAVVSLANLDVGTVRVPEPELNRITLRLPLAIIDHFMANGPDWRERLVEVIEREVEQANES